MPDKNASLKRERKTIKIMIDMYCRDHHGGGGSSPLCSECAELFDYAMVRLDKCKFQEDKPTCAKCPVHCYKPSMREKVRTVMRYSGPRMMKKHPVLAVQHLLDGKKKVKKK